MISILAAHKDWIDHYLHTLKREGQIPTLTKVEEYDLEDTPVSQIRDLLNQHPDDRIKFAQDLLIITRPMTEEEQEEETQANLNSRHYAVKRLASACDRDPKYQTQIRSYLSRHGITIPGVNDQEYKIFFTAEEATEYYHTVGTWQAEQARQDHQGNGYEASQLINGKWIIQ